MVNELIGGTLITVAIVFFFISIIVMAKEEKELGKMAKQDKATLCLLALTALFFDAYLVLKKEWTIVLLVSIILAGILVLLAAQFGRKTKNQN